MNKPATFGFVMFVACLQALLYLLLLPPWQHYDEPTHFEYAWLIANHGRLPAPSEIDQVMRREVAASMLQHDFYWNLDKPDLLTDAGEINIGVSELSHPPLYYIWVSIPLRFASHLDITTQLYLARTMSLILFLFTVALTAGLVRELTPSGHVLRWAVPLTLVFMPSVVEIMTAVNNDVGAVFICSAFLWGAVRTLNRGISVGRLCWILGTAMLAVLTKNTAAVAVVLVPVVILIRLLARRRWRLLALMTLCACILLGVAVIDWGNLITYSEPGTQRLRLQPWLDRYLTPYLRLPPSQLLAGVRRVPGIAGFLTTTGPFELLQGFFTQFAWGHVSIAHPGFSFLIGEIAAIALIGCVVWCVRHKTNQAVKIWPGLLFLVMSGVLIWASAMLRTLPIAGSTWVTPTARYAFPSVIPLALILAGGWWALWPRHMRIWGSAALLLLLFSINVISVWKIWSFYASLPTV